jgi:4-hydroxybenzoate polyprenyltransferase
MLRFTAVPSVVANFYYPWSKRHTHLAQFVLGVSLAWGVNVGTAALGVVPWEDDVLTPTACLFVASTFWTVIYDTIYAFQDIADDTRVGLKSTAVLFREYTKPFLWVCLSTLVTLMSAYGYLLKLGLGYYGIAIGGCVASLGAMIARVDLKNLSSCWWWFRYGFWLAGGSITGGLLWEFCTV